MSINKAENSLDKRLVTVVSELQRQAKDFKTPQPLGADVLKVKAVPSGSPLTGGPLTLIAGSSGTFEVTVTPASSILTLWNFAFTIYVDNLLDATYAWPSGSNLDVNTREAFVFNWLDWGDSGDIVNARTYKIRIRNSDPSATTHNYYLAVKAYLPTVGTS